VCCSVLQFVSVCCSGTRRRERGGASLCVLQRVAGCCSVLHVIQRVAVFSSMLQWDTNQDRGSTRLWKDLELGTPSQSKTKFGARFKRHCNTLQHTATHCNTLQHTTWSLTVAVCRRVSQSVAVCCGVSKSVAVCCSVSQSAAVCYGVLQCVAVCYGLLQCAAMCYNVLQRLTAFCSALQCIAVCCSMSQCVAVGQDLQIRVAEPPPAIHLGEIMPLHNLDHKLTARIIGMRCHDALCTISQKSALQS